MIATANILVEACRRHNLLAPQQLDELTRRLPAHLQEPKALAKELIQRGWLTPFQVNHLFQGRGPELHLGPYVLMERLGEGGMGQVFKARHRHMDRLVAIKLIRKKHLSKPEAVQRFQREVQIAAKLSDPHVVMAYDAQVAGDTYFFVMEYVDGIDLGQLLRKSGPLAIAAACDYIRQAALGLQHGCERGLVHRDIKPSNLLLTRTGGVIKILDMGLARVGDSVIEEGGQLTQIGRVMGTPEYMAPEQAVDAHAADIRADLYSLGCTFYHLLAGRPPFAEGTPVERIINHQTKTPVPVEQRRPEVPPAVAAVVARLLAKKPADRYQTPTELAAVLAGILQGARSPAPPQALPVLAARETVLAGNAWDTSDLAPPQAQVKRRYLREARKPLASSGWLIGAGIGIVLVLAVVIWAAWPSKPPAKPKKTTGAPQVREMRETWKDWTKD